MGWTQIISQSIATHIKNSKNEVSIRVWVGTQVEYDAITTKDPNTIYLIGDQ